MTAQWRVEFTGWERLPEIIAADSTGFLPDSQSYAFILTRDHTEVSEGTTTVAVFPREQVAAIRRLPEQPRGGLYAPIRRGLRWLFT